MTCVVHVEDLRFEASIHLGLRISNIYVMYLTLQVSLDSRCSTHNDLSESLYDSLVQLCGHVEPALLVRCHGIIGRVTVLGDGRMSLVRQLAEDMMRGTIAKVSIRRLCSLADMRQAA